MNGGTFSLTCLCNILQAKLRLCQDKSESFTLLAEILRTPSNGVESFQMKSNQIFITVQKSKKVMES